MLEEVLRKKGRKLSSCYKVFLLLSFFFTFSIMLPSLPRLFTAMPQIFRLMFVLQDSTVHWVSCTEKAFSPPV